MIDDLSAFTNEDWIIYIQNIRDGIQTNPPIEIISPDIFEQLDWIYTNLAEKHIQSQRLFVRSLIDVLDLTQSTPNTLKFIYDVLYFIGKYPPLEHRKLLGNFIRNRKFSNLSYGDFNLHLLFIKVYTKIEDKEKLPIEEYLLNNQYKKEPYFLYLITYYYAHTQHTEKALDSFSNYFKNLSTSDYEEISNYIYHTLKDCIPNKIDLTDFLERVFQDQIKFDVENPHIFNSIDKFCKYLIFIKLSLFVKYSNYLIYNN